MAGGPIAVFVILFLWVPPAQQVVSGSNNNIVKDTDGDVHINVTNTTSSEPAASGHAP